MLRLILVCVFVFDLLGQSQESYTRAVRAFNAGRIPEAKDQLAALLTRDPDFFKAYELYWRAVERTSGDDAAQMAIKQAMERFAQTPPAQRTEDYYTAYQEGLTLLKHSDDTQRVHREAIERFPRGLTAQGALLDAARDEKDPKRAAQLYQDYLDRFDDNISWNELAARDRFLLLEQHPDQFSTQDLKEAAAKWESRERGFFEEFGNPSRYLMAAREMAQALLDKDPAASLEFSRKGAAFVAARWADANEFAASAQEQFWPLMLEAQVNLRRWAPAGRLGDAVIQQIEAGRLFSGPTEAGDEAKVRRFYAAALAGTGKIAEARMQYAIAAALSEDSKKALDDYLARYPLGDEDREKLQSQAAAKAAEARERRTLNAKTKLLGTEQKQPSTPFRLKNLKGEQVALADFRGKAVVVAFWATWCGPCIQELAEVNGFYGKFAENPQAALLTVSIDDSPGVLSEFVEKQRYKFPVLKSDGTVESAYTTQKTQDGVTIPQLYVFDREGNMRFHIVGFDGDGLFEKKLDWMIEAALK
jgi:peroxiredoxin